MDLLFLAHRAPFPPDRGDRIRGWHVLKHLAERARVHLVAFADTLVGPTPGFLASCTVVSRTKSQLRAVAEALIDGKPASLTAFHDCAFAAAVRGVVAHHPIAATYAFSGQMAQYLPLAPHPWVMDFVDLDSAKFAAYAGSAGWPASALYRREARLLNAVERQVATEADASLFVSAPEAALLPGAQVLENGIDTGFFDPAANFGRVNEAGPLLVFTGQMDYRPNIEAARWFAAEILPRVRTRHPATRFAVVGRAPTREVRALASDTVLVTGEVADVRPWLAAAAVVVAPLRLARGVQNKVLEAMAMARPVVASAAAAEGIDDAGTIRVGHDADEIASEISALLAEPATASQLGMSARARVGERYGWEAALEPLDRLLDLRPGRNGASTSPARTGRVQDSTHAVPVRAGLVQAPERAA